MHKTSLKINNLTFEDKKRIKEALLFHLSNLREDNYLNSLKTKSSEIKSLTKENNKLSSKNQALITELNTLKEELNTLKDNHTKLNSTISVLEKSKREYEETIKKLKQSLKPIDDNTEIGVLRRELEKNKLQIQKDFNDKKELAKMVKKFKEEIDALKEEMKLFEDNPNLRRFSDSKSEEENSFVGFDFEIKKGPKKIKKIKKKDFEFLMESSEGKGITKKQISSEKKFKKKTLKSEAPLKILSPKVLSPKTESKKVVPLEKEPVKIESIKNLIKKEEKPQKSFFSSLNFDDSFFS